MEPGDKRRAGQTSVAASIKFDIVPKGKDATPEILSDGKSIVTPLRLHTLDGQACDALLRHPAAIAVSDACLVVMVHGSGSSHKQAPQADLGDRLAARGSRHSPSTAALVDAAKSDASLVRPLECVTLPSSLPASLDGHCFVGNEDALAETMCRWLDRSTKAQPNVLSKRGDDRQS